jgi:acetylornithine deacetylase
MTLSPVLRTLSDLVRINSVNPAFEGGRPEAEIAEFVRRFFERRGIEARLQEVLPGRPNVIARVPGRDPSRRLILEAHLDTVTTAGMTIPPFEPVVRDGRLWGRGACDTKAGLAALMHAAAALCEERVTPPCELWIVGAADEEHGFKGVLKLCEGLRAAGAVGVEPTELRLVTATRGCLRWRIVCRGRAAHSSKPHLGVNAIVAMARVILALETDAAGLARTRHPLVGSPTLSIGTIRGGVQVNIVPDRCEIQVDRRLIPGEEAEQVARHYAALVGAPDVSMEPPMLVDPPLETAPTASVAAVASRVLGAMGLDGAPIGVPYSTDASKLARAGIPTVVWGPGSIDQAHTADEFVACHEVERAVEFYGRVMREFEG